MGCQIEKKKSERKEGKEKFLKVVKGRKRRKKDAAARDERTARAGKMNWS